VWLEAERHGESHATGSKDYRPYLLGPDNCFMAGDTYHESNVRADQRGCCFNGYRGDRMGYKPLVVIGGGAARFG
jgi:hypothetical protein